MRIAVDAMGGDYGPGILIEGALAGARDAGCHIVLVGDKDTLAAELSGKDISGLTVEIHHASENIEMTDLPAVALRRKKDSSLRVCFELIKRGEAQAMVSAGNSGAIMAVGVMVLKRMAGLERPALALVLPTVSAKRTVFLDVGANVDCKPVQLAQFALMGSAYAKIMLGENEPKVALLSNGQEETKGNEITRLAHDLLKRAAINYQGYVEGRDLYSGVVDVIVCDGFVGNVALKVSEGMVDVMRTIMQGALKQSFLARLGYLLMGKPLGEFRTKFDYDEYGGAPLLGINGAAVISHGGASPRAIKNAIKLAHRFAGEKVNEHLARALAENSELLSFNVPRQAGAS